MKRLLFSVAILLSVSSAGYAETVIKEDFACRHLATLEHYDQRAYVDQSNIGGHIGHEASDFIQDQWKSGECIPFLKIGTWVRVDKRIRHPNDGGLVCVAPFGFGSPGTPCLWTSSETIE